MNRYEWLDGYLRAKAGAEKDYKEEWGWFRYRVDGKQFAATCRPDPKYKPHDGREMVLLKCDPRLAEAYRETYPDVVPGFYSDKRTWNSVYLDGAVPDEVLKQMCDHSYELVFAKLTKARQRELLAGTERE